MVWNMEEAGPVLLLLLFLMLLLVVFGCMNYKLLLCKLLWLQLSPGMHPDPTNNIGCAHCRCVHMYINQLVVCIQTLVVHPVRWCFDS